MGIEIERKFLINTMSCLDNATDVARLRQGYLNLDIDRTVRIRMYNHTGAWITVKGRNSGHTRKEYEYRIPEQDGEEMLAMCEGGLIDKMRYIIPHNDLKIEVDVFSGNNIGLVVAEIEFDESDSHRNLSFTKLKEHLPDWIDTEITDDDRYYNSALLTNPYIAWEK